MPDPTHIIALSTYGTQTKTRSGRRLSALKIGYTTAVADVLLALIPSATNISSNRDRYVYVPPAEQAQTASQLAFRGGE